MPLEPYCPPRRIAPFAATPTMNPNQPCPPILASDINPPPVWPLPVVDWVVPQAVPPGFPTGPFAPNDCGPVMPDLVVGDICVTQSPVTPGTGVLTVPCEPVGGAAICPPQPLREARYRAEAAAENRAEHRDDAIRTAEYDRREREREDRDRYRP